MAITMRKGLLSDFNPNRLLAGEWAVSIDPETKNQIVYMCFGAGIVKRMGTLEDFEEWFNTAFNNAIEPYEDVFNEIKDECEAIEADTRALEAQVITIRNSIINTYMPQIETAVASAESSAQDAQEAKDWIDNNFDIDIEKKSTVGLVDTYEITYQNTKTFDFDVTNGSKGDKGDKGDTGEGFEIFKTYPSIQDMEDDSANVPEGKFVLISTSVETEDNAKLFVKADTGFNFLTDLSGAQGIKGEKGDTGLGIASVTMADENKNHPITVAYTDGTSEVIGTIKDGQDGAGNIATYTTAGVVMPDSETITIDADGKIHAIGGSTDDIWEGTKSEYEAEKADIKDGTVVVINDDNADLPTFIDNNDLALTNGVLSLSGSVKDNLSQINTKLSNIDDLEELTENYSNPNLLDNPFFTLNSKGKTTYTNEGYCLDKWYKRESDKTTVTVNSDKSITMKQIVDNHGGWGNLFQEIDMVTDKETTVTLSVIAKGKFSLGFYGASPISFESSDYVLKTRTYNIPANTDLKNDWYCPLIGLSENATLNDTCTIKSVKLELGYISTLENDNSAISGFTTSTISKELSWVKTDSNFSSSDSVTVPISAKEINVLAHLGSKYTNVTYQILTSNIPLNETKYYRGGYYNSATDNQGITITVEHLSTGFAVGVANAYRGGTEKTSDIEGIVNYR